MSRAEPAGVTRIRSLIASAKNINIDIHEITVSPIQYDELMDIGMGGYVIFDHDPSQSRLIFHGVTINKRKCKGCCSHD